MAGSAVTVTLDDAAVRRALGALLSGLQEPSPAMRDIGEVLVRSTKQRFQAQADPQGKPWEQNSDVTLLRYLDSRSGSYTKAGRLSAKGAKRIGGKKILTDRGALGDTIGYRLEDGGRSVAVGSALKYAAMQQFGGTRGQWPHLWGDIPARPFLGISAADRDDILAILRHSLAP